MLFVVSWNFSVLAKLSSSLAVFVASRKESNSGQVPDLDLESYVDSGRGNGRIASLKQFSHSFLLELVAHQAENSPGNPRGVRIRGRCEETMQAALL